MQIKRLRRRCKEAVTNLKLDLGYQWASSLLGFIALAMTPFRKACSSQNHGQHANCTVSLSVLQIWKTTQGQVPFRTGLIARLGKQSCFAAELNSGSRDCEYVPRPLSIPCRPQLVRRLKLLHETESMLSPRDTTPSTE